MSTDDTSALTPSPRQITVRTIIRWSAVGAAAAGWLLSLTAFQISMSGKAVGPLAEMLCGSEADADAVFDCTSVLHSERAFAGRSSAGAQPRAGISWGALGMMYFSFIGIWYAFVGLPTWRRRWWHLVMLVLIGYGAYESIGLIIVMATELRRWCGLCLATHVLNGLLLVVTVASWPRRKFDPTPPHPSHPLVGATLTACGLAALLIIVVGQFGMAVAAQKRFEQAYRAVIDDPAYARWSFTQQPVRDIPVGEDDPLYGSPDAPHTLVVFSDFNCPACKLANDKISAMQELYAGRFRLTHRLYPQDPACNERYRESGGHPWSCQAARAARAALIVGGAQAYSQMRALLFERQHDIELDRFADWAVELGLDRDKFIAAMNSPEASDHVARHVALGNQLELKGVPALYLDGRHFEHWRNDEAWKGLLAIKD